MPHECPTSWFRRVDSNHRKRNQNPGVSPVIGSDPRDSAADLAQDATEGDASLPALPRSAAATDVDAALARALDAAVTAGRLDVVALVAAELRARRLASAGNVVDLASKRGGRP